MDDLARMLGYLLVFWILLRVDDAIVDWYRYNSVHTILVEIARASVLLSAVAMVVAAVLVGVF